MTVCFLSSLTRARIAYFKEIAWKSSREIISFASPLHGNDIREFALLSRDRATIDKGIIKIKQRPGELAESQSRAIFLPRLPERVASGRIFNPACVH